MLAHVCADLVQIYAEKQEKTEEKKGSPLIREIHQLPINCNRFLN